MRRRVRLAPEKVARSQSLAAFLLAAYQLHVWWKVIVDEAHCIDEHGRNFRSACTHVRKTRRRPGWRIVLQLNGFSFLALTLFFYIRFRSLSLSRFFASYFLLYFYSSLFLLIIRARFSSLKIYFLEVRFLFDDVLSTVFK